MTPLQVDLDLDDLPWVVGPTEARPFDVWLPEAVALMMRQFAPPRRKRKQVREYVTAMLTRVGRPDDDMLPYLLFRWPDPARPPDVAFFGLVGRDDEAARDFLAAAETSPVEAPVVEQVLAQAGVSVRRAVSYGRPDTALFVQVRYVVDDAHPEAVVYVQSGGRGPGTVLDHLADLDAVVVRMGVAGATTYDAGTAP